MPYKIGKRDGKTCVLKDDGTVVKCHDSADDAKAHLRALYKNVKDASVITINDPLPDPEDTARRIIEAMAAHAATDTPSTPSSYAVPVRLYFREGELTEDNGYTRVIDPHAINFNRQPPLPIRIQTIQPESGGHALSEVCGVVTKVARDGTVIVADGVIDTRIPAGANCVQMALPGPAGEPPILQTWSPDLGSTLMDEETNAIDEDDTSPRDIVVHVVEGTLIGFTIVALPAMSSAVFEMYDDAGNVISPAPTRQGRDYAPDDATIHTPVGSPTTIATVTSISACARKGDPPAEFFTLPPLERLGRWVEIEPSGRIFGLAAAEGECHIGYDGRCITIDEIADYTDDDCNFEYAMPGYTVTAEGTRVPTGPLAIKGGHAPNTASWKEALAHYDDPDTGFADVAYFKLPGVGIAFSGAVSPNATDDQLRIARARGVSLDARGIDGRLRYLATCAVNTPGFPKVKMRLAASAEGDKTEILALIGSLGAPVEVVSDDCPCCTQTFAFTAGHREESDRILHEKVAKLTTIIAISGLESDAFDNLVDQMFDTLEASIAPSSLT
jgi:hypothetical protein